MTDTLPPARRRLRIVVGAVTLTVAALALGGCATSPDAHVLPSTAEAGSASSVDGSSGSGPATPNASTSGLTTPDASTSGPAMSGPAMSGSATSSPSGALGVNCSVVELDLGVRATQGAAGHFYLELLFRNVGRRTCTLTGAPGVSFLDGAGRQLGPAAARDLTGHPVVTVTMRPGATAYSVLGRSDPGVFGDPVQAPCKAVMATRLRIYPPGSTQAVLRPFSAQLCSTDTGRAAVTPLAAGRMP